MCTHTHTCTSTGTLHRARGLRVRPFPITPPCRQPYSVFGGLTESVTDPHLTQSSSWVVFRSQNIKTLPKSYLATENTSKCDKGVASLCFFSCSIIISMDFVTDDPWVTQYCTQEKRSLLKQTHTQNPPPKKNQQHAHTHDHPTRTIEITHTWY